MKLENLHYFVSVVDEMNISQAAKKLFVSQQSLSNHINRLESELAIELFKRKPRLALTQAGIFFDQFARQALLLHTELQYKLRQLNADHDMLTVCIGPVRSNYYLPRVLPVFYEQYPYTEVKIVTGNDDDLNAIIMQHDADFYIGSASTMDASLIKIPLFQERFHLVGGHADGQEGAFSWPGPGYRRPEGPGVRGRRGGQDRVDDPIVFGGDGAGVVAVPEDPVSGRGVAAKGDIRQPARQAGDVVLGEHEAACVPHDALRRGTQAAQRQDWPVGAHVVGELAGEEDRATGLR